MEQRPGSNIVDFGIDLKEYYMSVEWDILEIPAKRNEELYVETPYPGRNLFYALHGRRYKEENVGAGVDRVKSFAGARPLSSDRLLGLLLSQRYCL